MSVKLQTKHIKLAKKIAIEVWNEAKAHQDYKTQRIEKIKAIRETPENIYAVINKFSLNNFSKMYNKLEGKKSKNHKELAKWIQDYVLSYIMNIITK